MQTHSTRISPDGQHGTQAGNRMDDATISEGRERKSVRKGVSLSTVLSFGFERGYASFDGIAMTHAHGEANEYDKARAEERTSARKENYTDL